MDNNYIIEGGLEGKKRLETLASLINPSTQRLIEMDAPLEGKKFLDVGCGGGTVSLLAASLVGSSGQVTGIDFDREIINLAQQDATGQQLQNVCFTAADVYDIRYEESFDIAYSRFLLSHLADPVDVIGKMIRSLKKGGRIILEDIDFSGHFCFPESKEFTLYLDCFTKAAKNNRQNPDIGLSLFHLLKQAGLDDVEFSIIQPSYHTGPGKWMAYLTMDKIRETVIKQGLLTHQEVETMLENLKIFTEDDTTIISLPRIFQAWGIKR